MDAGLSSFISLLPVRLAGRSALRGVRDLTVDHVLMPHFSVTLPRGSR